MKNKRLLFIFIISILSTKIFAQEEQQPAAPIQEPKSKAKQIMENIDIILQFEPTLYLSPESKRNNSNIVNIFYGFTFGASFPRDYFVSFQPTVSFFSMNHIWHGNIALPTEIENRTTTTLSFMLNLPAAFNFLFEKSRIQLTAGVGAFLRFGILSNGVNDNDSGYSGSAAGDVKLINNWFWEKARWLYASFGASWLYNITSKIKIGPVLNVYVPFTSIIEYKKPQDMIISLGVKICR